MKKSEVVKLERDAMTRMGTLVRSTKTEPEHRVSAAKVILDHVEMMRSYDEQGFDVYDPEEEEDESV